MASEAHEKKRAGMIAKLPAKTGRTLEQWVRIAARAPAAARASDKALADWLKTEATAAEGSFLCHEGEVPTHSAPRGDPGEWHPGAEWVGEPPQFRGGVPLRVQS
jgi:hypothetical protein